MAKAKGFKGKSSNRASHRGFDIYRTGNGESVPYRYRILLRRNRIPVTVNDPVFEEHIPDEIWCPLPDVEDSKAIIDAIYECRLSYLIEIKNRIPGHHFGFEPFLDWAQRRAGKGEALDSKDRFLNLPAGKPLQRSFIRSTPYRGLRISLYVIRFSKDDSYFEAIIHDREETYSKLYYDPDAHKYRIMEHYPVLYEEIGLNPTLPWQFFNLPLLKMDPYTRIGFHIGKDPVESGDAQTADSRQ